MVVVCERCVFVVLSLLSSRIEEDMAEELVLDERALAIDAS